MLFRANAGGPIYQELKSIVVKTVGVADILRSALMPYAGVVKAAFVYGSFARGEQRQSSDVDVMIIGDFSIVQSVSAFREAQRLIGREINPTVYSPIDFAEKLRLGHHFLTNVMRGEKLFLLGDDVELKRLAKERLAATARPQRGRNQATDGSRGARSARLHGSRTER